MGLPAIDCSPVRNQLLCISLLFLPAILTADPPPVEVFASLPPIKSVSLSPDGTKAVILKAINDTYHVTITDLETRKSRMLMAAKPDEFLFNACNWANNKRIICSIRSYIVLKAGQLYAGSRWYRDGRTVATRLLAVNADGSDVMQLVPPAVTKNFNKVVWNSPNQSNVISMMREDPNHILMQIARDDRIRPSVYKLNINTNKLERTLRYRDSVLFWYADSYGEIRFASGYRSALEPIAFTMKKGRPNRIDIQHLLGINPPSPLGFTADGKGVYVSSNNGKDKRGIYEVNLADGKVVSELYSDPDYDIYGGLWLHRLTHKPVVLGYYREDYTLHWFDQDLKARYDRVVKVLPGAPAAVRIISVDDNWNRFVLYTEGNQTLPTYYLYDDAAKSLKILATSYKDLDKIVEMKSVRYPARDGKSIPAYYAVPDEPQKGPYPTIVFPHGGPYARDVPNFDYWTQFFVSRGFAVIKPNFRGSSGYGDAYMKAGFEEWGLKMQDDVIDGLDWMIKEGISDRDKVCIVGGSYGGYVALVAAFKTPERFRCAVSFAGVTDLPELATRWYNFLLGELSVARIQSGKSRRENSPLDQVEKIRLPLLIVHGDVDRSVMIEQSRDLVAALEKAGKPYRYIEQTNGDHFLSLQSHRIEFFRAMDEFLQKHLRD